MKEKRIKALREAVRNLEKVQNKRLALSQPGPLCELHVIQHKCSRTGGDCRVKTGKTRLFSSP